MKPISDQHIIMTKLEELRKMSYSARMSRRLKKVPMPNSAKKFQTKIDTQVELIYFEFEKFKAELEDLKEKDYALSKEAIVQSKNYFQFQFDKFRVLPYYPTIFSVCAHFPHTKLMEINNDLLAKLIELNFTPRNSERKYSIAEINLLLSEDDKVFIDESGVTEYIIRNEIEITERTLQKKPDTVFANFDYEEEEKFPGKFVLERSMKIIQLVGFNKFLTDNYPNWASKDNIASFWYNIFAQDKQQTSYRRSLNIPVDRVNLHLNGLGQKDLERLTEILNS